VKLKFERFEGLSSFSVRGEITAAQIKILQIGLENLVKDLDSTLVVNLRLAKIDDSLTPVIQAIKKSLAPPEKIKLHWISSVKGVGDFSTLVVFTSRLTGFKHRQIGERLVLDDEIYELNQQLIELQEKVNGLSGNEDKALAHILENRTLKAQERVLKETIKHQKERLKLQVHIPTVNEELPEKMKVAREALKAAYGVEYDL
jgi:hypothetical protein